MRGGYFDATQVTEAINLRQLDASIQQANAQQPTQARTEFVAGDAATLQAATAYTDQRINQLMGFDFTRSIGSWKGSIVACVGRSIASIAMER